MPWRSTVKIFFGVERAMTSCIWVTGRKTRHSLLVYGDTVLGHHLLRVLGLDSGSRQFWACGVFCGVGSDTSRSSRFGDFARGMGEHTSFRISAIYTVGFLLKERSRWFGCLVCWGVTQG
jgi:hypothetical protein